MVEQTKKRRAASGCGITEEEEGWGGLGCQCAASPRRKSSRFRETAAITVFPLGFCLLLVPEVIAELSSVGLQFPLMTAVTGKLIFPGHGRHFWLFWSFTLHGYLHSNSVSLRSQRRHSQLQITL